LSGFFRVSESFAAEQKATRGRTRVSRIEVNDEASTAAFSRPAGLVRTTTNIPTTTTRMTELGSTTFGMRIRYGTKEHVLWKKDLPLGN